MNGEGLTRRSRARLRSRPRGRRRERVGVRRSPLSGSVCEWGVAKLLGVDPSVRCLLRRPRPTRHHAAVLADAEFHRVDVAGVSHIAEVGVRVRAPEGFHGFLGLRERLIGIRRGSTGLRPPHSTRPARLRRRWRCSLQRPSRRPISRACRMHFASIATSRSWPRRSVDSLWSRQQIMWLVLRLLGRCSQYPVLGDEGAWLFEYQSLT